MKRLLFLPIIFLATILFAQPQTIRKYDSPPLASELDCSIPTPILNEKYNAQALQDGQTTQYPFNLHFTHVAYQKG